MQEEKLIKYITGSLKSKKEKDEVLDWIEESEENQEQYTRLKNLWVATGTFRTHKTLSRNFFVQQESQKKVRILSQSILKYAAIFLVSFFIGAATLYFANQANYSTLGESYNVFEVPSGEKSLVTLYDGTKVWLNSGTKLKYPVLFDENERVVEVEGEAFFDVAKNEKQPFIVEAGKMRVKVLGTRFDVCAYPSENFLQTTLEEGAVSISISGINKSFKLNPGEQFDMTKGSSPKLLKVDTDLYTSWKENILKFEDAELSEILKKMERWYGVNINIDKNLNTSERYTLSIKTESLREILNVLSLTTHMNYEINQDIVKIRKP